jgi:hypothetical protein
VSNTNSEPPGTSRCHRSTDPRYAQGLAQTWDVKIRDRRILAVSFASDERRRRTRRVFGGESPQNVTRSHLTAEKWKPYSNCPKESRCLARIIVLSTKKIGANPSSDPPIGIFKRSARRPETLAIGRRKIQAPGHRENYYFSEIPPDRQLPPPRIQNPCTYCSCARPVADLRTQTMQPPARFIRYRSTECRKSCSRPYPACGRPQ